MLEILENAKNILRWSKIVRDFSVMVSWYEWVQDVQDALKWEEMDIVDQVFHKFCGAIPPSLMVFFFEGSPKEDKITPVRAVSGVPGQLHFSRCCRGAISIPPHWTPDNNYHYSEHLGFRFQYKTLSAD